MAKKAYHHATFAQRCQIQALLSIGESRRKIGVSASTVCGENTRNSGVGGYNPQEADKISAKRRSSASGIPKKMSGDVKALALRGLEEDWSPEQISGRLKLQGISISHETIYEYVRRDKAAGGLLYEHLCSGKKKYRSKKTRQAGVNCIPNRVDIAERPAIVDEKYQRRRR
jgi:IS30 family transposase